MIKVQDISHSFGENEVLRRVSLEVKTGTLSGLIGPSGVGKSVLLKIIANIYNPQSGTVTIQNPQENSSSSEKSLVAENDISLMFQEGALFDSLTVFDNIGFPLVNGNVPVDGLDSETRESVRERVEEILGHVGLKKAAFKIPAQLSGGMRRRVSLARALVAKPSIVLLDDPTCGLDPVASSVIMNLIVEVHKEYRPTMVLVSHDLRRLIPIVSDVYALFDGQISFSGDARNILSLSSSDVQDFVSCRYDGVVN